MTISGKNDHTCDNNCSECDSALTCDRSSYKQLDFAFDFDVEDINWETIPEVDIAPEASEEPSDAFNQRTDRNLLEEIRAKDEIDGHRAQRAMNKFLKEYSSKLLTGSLVAVVALYLMDLIVISCGGVNSKFADPLFTLFQTIITTVIGYLIGSNQKKD